MNMTKKRNPGVTRVTAEEMIQICTRLDEVLIRLTDDVYAYPDDDTNDQTIADELRVEKAAVSRVRLECFGYLRPEAPPIPVEELEYTIFLLSMCVRSWRGRYEELKLEHNR